ncbi:MAG: EAL domain-containing protein [Epsilonproteobacteria bacterium]|nr:EAL domain-containing protein [Campylobacterota bacterium]
MFIEKLFYPISFILTMLPFNLFGDNMGKNFSFLNAYKMAIDETSIVSKTDLNGTITYVNKQFCEISGYEEYELLGVSHNIVRHPDMPKDVFATMWKTIQSNNIWRGVIKNRKKNGDYYIVNATVIPIVDSSNNIIEYIAIRHDITELEDSKNKIAQQKIDILTKLPNKNAFLDDIKEMKKPIVFYLNIDEFMSLNNLYGNKIGDKVLIHMANLLKNINIDGNCNIYKVYNDEFLVLCEEGEVNMDNYREFLLDLINSIENSTINCNAPECITFTLSAGVAYYAQDKNYENLSIYASVARSVAKLERKKFLLYNEKMQREEDYAKNIAWIKRIKEAIKDNRFVPYFQPIKDNKSQEITKYEALVRMIDKKGDVVPPFCFLDIAKKAKLYPTITRAVIDKTLDMFIDYPEYSCSINLSTEDIMNSATRTYIYGKLQNYPHPKNIIFEITESEEITDFKTVNSFIKKVREYGVGISIDDFGTGYANFGYILSLDVDYIKIDGGLIKNIDTDKDSHIVVEAIIAFTKKLGAKTIVEFVCNQEVQNEVLSLGADYSQGYFIGKPKATLLEEESVK